MGPTARDRNSALKQAKRVVVVISRAYLQNPTTEEQWLGFFDLGPLSVIPVKIEDCQPEGALRPIGTVDCTGLTVAEARAHLLSELRASLLGGPRVPRFPQKQFPTYTSELSDPALAPAAAGLQHRLVTKARTGERGYVQCATDEEESVLRTVEKRAQSAGWWTQVADGRFGKRDQIMITGIAGMTGYSPPDPTQVNVSDFPSPEYIAAQVEAADRAMAVPMRDELLRQWHAGVPSVRVSLQFSDEYRAARMVEEYLTSLGYSVYRSDDGGDYGHGYIQLRR